MGSKPRIAIVGAGIGGLSLGLALRERGLQANVFEQASELTEIGAAIAMSANSTREFMRLGLVDQIAAASTIPTELIYRHWRDGNRIAAHPVAKDDWYVRRFGAPYFGIHRADLQKILSGAFGVENLHLGCRLVNIVDQAESVVLEFANGRVEHANLVVGADGVRSTVRRWVTGADDAIYSQRFRGIVVRTCLRDCIIQFWMAMCTCSYASGATANRSTSSRWSRRPDLDARGSVSSWRRVRSLVPGWHPAIRDDPGGASRVGLFGVRPLLRWHRGASSCSATPPTGCCPTTGRARTPPLRMPSLWPRCSPTPTWTTSSPCCRATRACAGPGLGRSSGARG